MIKIFYNKSNLEVYSVVKAAEGVSNETYKIDHCKKYFEEGSFDFESIGILEVTDAEESKKILIADKVKLKKKNNKVDYSLQLPDEKNEQEKKEDFLVSLYLKLANHKEALSLIEETEANKKIREKIENKISDIESKINSFYGQE